MSGIGRTSHRFVSLVVDRYVLLVGIDDEDRKQARRLGLACILADGVVIARKLREAFAGMVGRDRAAIDLTADCAFEDRCIDEG